MTELVASLQLARGDFRLAVELVCPPGITCVMGPSGSGKSTILAALAGLALPDGGRVTLGDEVWLDRARGDRRPGPSAAAGVRVPGPGAVPAPVGARQRRVRHARRPAARARGAGGGAARAARGRPPRAAPAAHVLGRRGAAGGARARDRAVAGADPARRAVLRARSRPCGRSSRSSCASWWPSWACRSSTSRTRSPRRGCSRIRWCGSSGGRWSRAARPTRCSRTWPICK